MVVTRLIGSFAMAEMMQKGEKLAHVKTQKPAAAPRRRPPDSSFLMYGPAIWDGASDDECGPLN